jgi:arylsulfatase A-like enzyme
MKLPKRILIIIIASITALVIFLLFYDTIFPPRPNILLISIDTLRPDWLSCYDKVQYPTPNIDKLAAEGILFENSLTTSPITLPAHFSMLYSLLPYEEKVFNNGNTIKTEKPSVTQLLKEADKNLQTGAVISLGVLKRKFGLDAGFDYYNDYFPPEKGLWYRRAEEITDEALKWLQEKKTSKHPFFFFLHYSDPHEPYSPPDISPDLQVYFNDELQKEVALSSGEEYRLLLNLKLGLNEVKFFSLNDNGDPMDSSTKESQCYFNLLRVIPLIGVNIKYKDFIISNLPRKNRLYLGNPAILHITNNSKREEKVVLSFAGRRGSSISEIRDLYGREVQYCDQQIGRLIEKLKEWQMLDNLIIILVSDHGEGLGQHNLTGHIDQLYDSLLKVTFIIYNPKLKQKSLRVKQQVGLIDIAPTILNLWKIKKPEWMKGMPLLTSKLKLVNPLNERIFFSETFTPEAKATKFGLRTKKWKLIYTPIRKRWELYDIENDIGENHNIYREHKKQKEIIELQDTLMKKFAALLDLKQKIEKDKLDRETLEMLKSLGYIH